MNKRLLRKGWGFKKCLHYFLTFLLIFPFNLITAVITVEAQIPILPGGIVINEIMPNPEDVTDTNGEWFELYNTNNFIVDINGWTIKDNGSNTHIINNGGPLNIPANDYLVLGKNGDFATNGGVNIDYDYDGFVLDNVADEIVLLDIQLNEIDRVEYSAGTGWYVWDIGNSKVLNDFSNDNNDASNWCDSTTLYGVTDVGTPGTLNDSCDKVDICHSDGHDNGGGPGSTSNPYQFLTIRESAWNNPGNGSHSVANGDFLLAGSGYSVVDSDCVLLPVCGDNSIDSGEECDDGNIENGDGCDSQCKIAKIDCPFTATQDQILVNFTKTLVSYNSNYQESVTTGVPAGLYDVKLSAFDGYVGRNTVSQPHEQYKVVLKDSSSIIASSGMTDDLADNVLYDSITNTVNNALVVSSPATKVVATHAFYPDLSSPNSVKPICALFTPLVCGDGIVSGNEECDDGNDVFDDNCSNECELNEPNLECILELTKVGDKETVVPGEEIIYNLTLSNTGTANCTGGGVRLKDTFDSNTSFINQNIVTNVNPVISLENNTSDYIQWNFNTLEPGESGEIALTMLVSLQAECDSTLVNEASFWSNQTNWGDVVTEETTVVCPTSCGDGVVNDLEVCDNGDQNGVVCDPVYDTSCNYCSLTCEEVVVDGSYCGDGTIDFEEYCDDGNTESGDGCNNSCEIESCDLIMARVIIDESSNQGNSSYNDKIYVGSSDNVYNSGEWFPLSENGALIEDLDVLNYENVTGLAIQRMNGQVRLVLHGGNPTTNDIEHVRGHIEFLNANPTHLLNDTSGDNTLENDAVVGGYNDNDGTKAVNAGEDEVWLSDADNYSHFWLTVNVADDGYYTEYESVAFNQCEALCTDVDLDGYAIEGGECGPIDCVDNNALINPGAVDVCGNQIDENCDGIDEQCALEGCDLIMARVNINQENVEGSNITNDIYVGSSDNIYASGEWFPLFENGSYINDVDVEGYEAVNGIAVERLEGTVRLVLGNLDSSLLRHVDGEIEFYNALPAHLRNDSDNSLEGDLESGGYNDSNGGHGLTSNANNDEVWLNNTDDEAHFWLGVTTGDDGFYTDYSLLPIEQCLSNTCGNLELEIGEVCDDGVANGLYGYCNATCSGLSAFCGDDVVNGEEECDGSENCTDECRLIDLVCTDQDEDGYFVEGGDCGPIDCDDNNSTKNTSCAGGGGGETYGNIFGVKFNDLNANGIWELEEPTLSGWEINLYDYAVSTSTPILTATTTSEGYAFTNLELGSYLVTEVNQNGWSQTAPTTTSEIILTTSNQSFELNFGNFKPLVCTDQDADGYTVEGGECGLVDCNDNNVNQNTNCGGGGNGGGGGGGGSISSLYIHSESASIADNNTAKVIWYTNMPANTQLVCGLNSIANNNLGAWPNLGYVIDFGVEDTQKTFHEVLVSNVLPNTDYYCRAISEKGTKVYSNEITFRIENSATSSFCGDGVVNNNEKCDDGNNISGDGCSAICGEEDCVGADYVFETKLDVIGQGCQKPGWTIFQNQDTEVVDILATGLYKVYAEVHRSGREESQPAENIIFSINNIVGSPMMDRPGDETLQTQFAGDFIFYTGLNNVIINTGANCPPDTTPNSVEVKKVCLYKIETETLCGDGNLEVGEICDDGNRLNGDGCNNQCQIEIDNVTEDNASEVVSSVDTTPISLPVGGSLVDDGIIGDGEQVAEGEVLGEKVIFDGEKDKSGDNNYFDNNAESDKKSFLADWWWLILLLILAGCYYTYEKYRAYGKKE